MKREYLVPTEDIWTVMDNKYKAVVIIAKEAKRISQFSAQSPEHSLATSAERFLNKDIEYEEEKE